MSLEDSRRALLQTLYRPSRRGWRGYAPSDYLEDLGDLDSVCRLKALVELVLRLTDFW